MKRVDSESGFTLIEALIAMVILSLGILTLNTMQLTSISGNSSANRISGATDAASDQIEQIFSQNYATLLDDESADGTPGTGDGTAGLNDATVATADGTATSPDGSTIYWNVADNTPMPQTKTVRIIVQNSGKQVTFDYIKAWVLQD